jgi:hypothetical protein
MGAIPHRRPRAWVHLGGVKNENLQIDCPLFFILQDTPPYRPNRFMTVLPLHICLAIPIIIQYFKIVFLS